jgi:hypothetical protein
MSHALLLVLGLVLSGCACAGHVGLLATGVAGAVVTRDPGAAAAVALDLTPQCVRACKVRPLA